MTVAFAAVCLDALKQTLTCGPGGRFQSRLAYRLILNCVFIFIFLSNFGILHRSYWTIQTQWLQCFNGIHCHCGKTKNSSASCCIDMKGDHMVSVSIHFCPCPITLHLFVLCIKSYCDQVTFEN